MIDRTISSYLVGAFAVAFCTATSNVGGAAPPKKLSITLPAFSNIQSDFKIGPDGSWVVYRADQDQDEVYELYCVALTGTACTLCCWPGGTLEHKTPTHTILAWTPTINSASKPPRSATPPSHERG